MVLGQTLYHHIPRLGFSHEADRKTPMAVHLPLGWALSGPPPSSSGLLSTCFKCNAEGPQLVSEFKVWYELEGYGTNKQHGARSAANQRAHTLLELTSYHDGEWHWAVILWADDSSTYPANTTHHWCRSIKTLEKQLEKNSGLKNNYTETKKRTSIKLTSFRLNRTIRSSTPPVSDVHTTTLSSTQTSQIRFVVYLSGASKLHGQFLNDSLLVGSDLLQNFLHMLMRFRQH